MIYEGSMDYIANTATLLFDGERPSPNEIGSFCYDSFGKFPVSCEVDRPYVFKGLENPGTIYVVFD